MMFKTTIVILATALCYSSSTYSQSKSEHNSIDLFSIQTKGIAADQRIDRRAQFKIIHEKPQRFMLPVLIKNEKVEVQFKRHKLLGAEYELTTSSGKIINSEIPVCYSGKIKSNDNSIVTLLVTKNKIDIKITTEETRWQLSGQNDKIHVAPFKIKQLNELNNHRTFTCDSNIKELSPLKSLSKKQTSSTSEGVVSIYIEADHDLYLQKGNVSSLESYIHNVFLQVAHIYSNENIDVEISQIKVWDTPDTYDVSSSLNALTSFRSKLGSDFNGQLAHLLSGNSANHGGKAYIDVLCNKNKAFGYSNVLGNYSGLSDYSWDAFIIAHELGHNFGSRHTHECVWGPQGNMALDNCGRENETCEIIPQQNAIGSIMSYCHITDVGISFAAGFGQEPGNLIRSRYNACNTETGINCETAILISENGKYTALGPVKGFGASHGNADHSNWFKFVAPSDGKIKLFNCPSGADSRLWVHSGTCDNMIIIEESDDVCGNGGNFNYSSSIPQLDLNKGEQIFIEWDDRWSDVGFDFYFKFGPSSL